LRCFAAPRALAAKSGGATHAPSLRVLFLPTRGDGPDELEGLPRRTPFRDLDDWIVRGHARGTKASSREAGRLGALDGERFVVEVPDPAGARTLVGGAAALDGGTLVVVFEALSDHVDKLRKDAERALASVERAAADAGAARVEPRWRPDPTVTDAAAREAARRRFAAAAVEAAMSDPELGWKASKAEPWLVLSAADAGFTKKSVTAAQAARQWCETKLAGLRSAEPLPA